MPARDSRRAQRPVWAALTALLLIGMVASLFLAARAKQSAEAAATARAQVAVQNELAPLLTSSDVAQPATGERYQTLSALVTRRLLSAGSSDGVTLYSADGTVLFGLERGMVGRRVPSLRGRIDGVLRDGRQSEVRGDTFHAFVPLRLRPDEDPVGVVDVTQPYTPLWESASKPWRLASIAFAALLLPALGMLVLTFRGSSAQVASRAPWARPGAGDADAPASRSTTAKRVIPPTAPVYEHPGYRAEVEARRHAEDRAARAEEAAESLRRELKDLQQRGGGDAATDARHEQRVAEAQQHARAAEAERVQLADRLRRTETQRAELYQRLDQALAEIAETKRQPSTAAEDDELKLRAEVAERTAADAERKAAEAERKADEAARIATDAERASAEARTRVATAERNAAEAEAACRAAEADARAAREQSAETADERVRAAEQRLAVATEQLTGATEQLGLARAKAEEADARARAADGAALGAEARAADAEARAAEWEAQLALAQAALAAAQGRAEEAERALAESEERSAREASAAGQRLEAMKAEAQAASDRAVEAERALGNLNDRLADAHEQARAAAAELATVQEQSRIAAERLTEAESRLELATERAEAERGEAITSRERAAAAEEEVAAARSQLALEQERARTAIDETARLTQRAEAAEETLRRVVAEREAEAEEAARRAEGQPQLEEVLRITKERLHRSAERLQSAEERARAAEHELTSWRERVEELEGTLRREKLHDALQHLRGEEQPAAHKPPLEERRAAAPFMKALSLDARNSVAAIQGLVLAMKHSEKADDQPSMLRKLNAHARKLDRLVGDLLDADRLARGDIELKVRRTDVQALAKRVLEECALDGDRNVHLESEKVVVAVDPIRVEGIIVALLNNAVDRSRPRHEIVVRVDAKDGGALISVEDDEPSSDASMSPVVARFADVHRGWAIVESRPGGGSAFRVFLPDHDGNAHTTIAPERDTIEIRDSVGADVPAEAPQA
jgi:hypothetical protein